MSNELEKRMAGLSDDDLLELITKRSSEYTPEAVKAASVEADRRGGVAKLQAAAQARVALIRQEQERAQAERQQEEAEQARQRAERAREEAHALRPHGIFSDTRTLKDETLSEVQFALVKDAADHAQQVIDGIKRKLGAARMPLDCRWGVVEVKTQGWVSRVRRDFLIVELSEFADYHAYISARPFGTYLDCMRALTIEPGFVKKLLSRKLTGDDEALSAPKNILKHQDLSAWNEIVKDCYHQAIDELVVSLGQTPASVRSGEKKFLDIW